MTDDENIEVVEVAVVGIEDPNARSAPEGSNSHDQEEGPRATTKEVTPEMVLARLDALDQKFEALLHVVMGKNRIPIGENLMMIRIALAKALTGLQVDPMQDLGIQFNRVVAPMPGARILQP